MSSSDEFNQERKQRKSKETCKKLIYSTLNPSESESEISDYEYDSDVDPEFKYSNSNYSIEEVNSSSEDQSSEDDMSVISHFTDLSDTFGMLYTDKIPSKRCNTTDDDLTAKQLSNRKISEKCLAIFGLAQKNFWDGNYDEAQNLCTIIIKEYPSYSDAYDILAQIYEHNGDLHKANQLHYTSAMCNPKDKQKWISCIESTKQLKGIDKAIKMAKTAMSRSPDNDIRMLYINLLEEGGYEKEALKRKLMTYEAAPSIGDPVIQLKTVLELYNMCEKFEQLQDFKRSTMCLEIIAFKYPRFLTDDHRINLLKLMITVNRYNGLLNIISGFEHAFIQTESPKNLLSFSDKIFPEYRQPIIIACIYAAIHLKTNDFILSQSFFNYMTELVDLEDEYLNISRKLYNLKYFQIVLDLAKYLISVFEKDLEAFKLLGQCQEALGQDNDALKTYDYIINEINGEDVSVWELKANLLYRLHQEEDAIQVLKESQRFCNKIRPGLTERSKPTKESLQLLYKLCEILYNEKRYADFIKAAWKFIFIDSFEFFEINKIRFCCEDIDVAKENYLEIQNNIWLCLSRRIDSDGHCVFESSHPKSHEDLSTWKVLELLLNLLSDSDSDDFIISNLLELLAQWGLVLQKILNWNPQIRLQLSTLYVVIGLKNRLRDPRLRIEVSGSMVFQELRLLRMKYGEEIQYWNLFQIYCHIMDITNNRLIIRSMAQTKFVYPLEIINSGYVLTSSAKLGLLINNKLYSEHTDNSQLCLQMAITLGNISLSRNCRDTVKSMILAVAFISQYRKIRGDCQETFFNLGRFYHRIGLENYALNYYEQCIKSDCVGHMDQEKSMTDFTLESAYNMILIFKRQRNKPMAAYFTQKYVFM